MAKKDNKYGIIDAKGNIKLYIEYDQIGIDNRQFEQNNINFSTNICVGLKIVLSL